MGLKLNHVSKRGHWALASNYILLVYVNVINYQCDNLDARAHQSLWKVHFMNTVKPLIKSHLISNKIADQSDVVGASPVGTAPTTSSFSTKHLALLVLANTTAILERIIYVLGHWVRLILQISL